MHPTQIQNAIDLADQMVGWHDLVEIKRIKELDLPILPPTHHAQLPPMSVPNQRNHGSRVVSTRVLQHNPPESGLQSGHAETPLCAKSDRMRMTTLFDHLVGAQ